MSYRNGLLSFDPLILILAIAIGLEDKIIKKIKRSGIPAIVSTSAFTNTVMAVIEAPANGKFLLTAGMNCRIVSTCLYFSGKFAAGSLSVFDFSVIIIFPFAAAAFVIQV